MTLSDTQVHYQHAKSPMDFQSAKQLFIEYAQSLHLDLAFQNFDEELADLSQRYSGQTGDLIMAYVDHEVAGGVAVHQFESGIGEMKRLYVKDQFRSLGIGHELVARILASAASMGYQSVRLDTIPAMKPAQKIYREAGFQDIEPYRYNPVPGTIYMACELA